MCLKPWQVSIHTKYLEIILVQKVTELPFHPQNQLELFPIYALLWAPSQRSGWFTRFVRLRMNVKNDWPVALISILSKVLEANIHSKVINFICPKLLKQQQQHGFMNKWSCVTQSLTYFSKIFNSIGENCPSDVLYRDLQKAFNSVLHEELLFKLWVFGIIGQLWSWFKPLVKWFPLCFLNRVSSNHLPVLSVVLQGSILGPFSDI